MLAQQAAPNGQESPLLTTRDGIQMAVCRTNGAYAADTSYSHEISDDNGHDNNTRRLWSPFFLRRSTMTSFLVAFVAILSTLITLYYYYGPAGKKNGIGTDDWKYYYLWTYGPTAVFMLIGAFWAQVEYRACQLMPWLLMSQSPTVTSNSVLLDYTSPWNVVSLFRSLKSDHYLVSLAITGTLFIHGLAVVSTSLFELDAVRVQRRTPLQLTHTFNGPQFDPHAVDPRPFMRTWAKDWHNLSAPVGVAANHAFQPFREMGLSGDANYTLGKDREVEAEVDLLTVNLECEDATLHINLTDWVLPYSMEASDCASGPLSEFSAEDVEDYPAGQLAMAVHGCNGKFSYAKIPSDGEFERGDWRLWAFLSRQDPDGRQVDANSTERFAFTPVMCTPHYSMSRGPVRLSQPSGSGAVVTNLDLEEQRPLPLLSDTTPAHILYASVRSVAMMFSFESHYLLARTRDELEPFMDSSLLSRQLESSMRSIGAQVAWEYLLQPEESSIEGITASVENRLFVRQLSFGLMVGLLASLIIISISILYFYLPLSVCCRDPSSIGGLATILTQSPEFRETLRNMELKQTLEMQDLLAEQQYNVGLGSDGTFSINVKKGRYPQRRTISGSEDSPRWWRPPSTRFYMQIFTFGVPIALIITIEVLLDRSKAQGGVASVGSTSDGRHQPWAYIPALVMFGARILFQMTEFNTRIFQPFHFLSRGRAKANTSILENQHRKIAAYGIFDSLRKKQWALAASSIALLLAAMLPIAVSGLYAVDSVPSSTRLLIAQRDKWDLAAYKDWLSPASEEDDPSDVVGGMVVYLDLPYPQWTYEELAFPQIGLSPQSLEESDPPFDNSIGYVESRLPAWRLDLHCDEIEQSDYSISWTYVHNKYYPETSGPYINMNVTGIEESCRINTELGQVLPEGVEYFSTVETVETTEFEEPTPPDCPTHLYVFGKSVETNTTEALKVLKCRPKIEEVDADVWFEVPSFTIDLSRPPSVVPGSARVIADGYFPDTAPPRVIIPGNMGKLLINSDLNGEKAPYLNDVISAAIHGTNGIPADELLADATRLENALSSILGVTITQVFNSQARVPINSTTPPTFVASLVTERDRLVQSPVSSRILVGLLSAMVVCGAISIALLNTNQILPKNPCSIAAVASLLVGSRMVESREIIPAGAQWWDDAELKRRGVFVNQTFTMGWWLRKRRRESVDGAGDSEDGDGETLLEDEKVFGIDVDEADC